MTTNNQLKRAYSPTSTLTMSQAEFDAIGKLMRLRDSACRRATEMVLVQGKTAKEAAEANGITLASVYITLKRIRRVQALINIAK
jgi:DNA-directed RNA polymerase specialized sigma24 family protein